MTGRGGGGCWEQVAAGQQTRGFRRSPGLLGQRGGGAARGRYLGETDAQSGGTHPRGDQSGRLNGSPPKGPCLQHGARTIGPPPEGEGFTGPAPVRAPPPFLLSFCAQMDPPPSYRRAGV